MPLPSGVFTLSPVILFFALMTSCSTQEPRLEEEVRTPSLVTAMDNSEGIAKALFEEGNQFYRANSYKDAIDKYEQALELTKQYDLLRLQANILERLASVHMSDNPGYAFKLYLEALRLFEKIPDSTGIAKVFNIIGFIKVISGNTIALNITS